jgi:hypothetical protein
MYSIEEQSEENDEIKRSTFRILESVAEKIDNLKE